MAGEIDNKPEEFEQLPEEQAKPDPAMPPLKPLSDQVDAHLKDLLEDKLGGIPVGIFPRLNALLGGLRDINIVTGTPGVGKSSFVLPIGLDASMRGYCVLYYSLEMPALENTRRSLLMRSRSVGNWKVLRQSRGLLEEAVAAVRESAKFMHIIDNSTRVSLSRIEREVVYMRKLNGEKPLLIIIDHARLVDMGKDYQDSLLRQEDLLANLMSLVQRHSATILLVHELNKVGFEGMKLQGVKGSVSAVYDATTVMGLVDPESQDDIDSIPEFTGDLTDTPEPKTVRVVVRKNRNGPANYYVPFKFDGALFRFREVPLPKKAL